MRLIHTYLVTNLIAFFILSSCTDDELFRRNERVTEGMPTCVTLRYGVQNSQVFTRAAQETQYEYRVENLYILVFDSNGNRIPTTDSNKNPKSFFTENSGLTVNNTNNSSNGSVTFNATTANEARIVGIANLRTETTSTAYDLEPSELDAITTLSELENLVMPLYSQNSVERGSLFMMTGYGEDKNGNTSITISGAEGGTTTLDCTLKLRRTDAKVTVNVTSSPTNANWTHFAFEPKTWQVMRVPNQSLLLPFEKTGIAGVWIDSETADWDAERINGINTTYFDTEARPFEVMNTKEEDNTKYYTGGSFVFYMPENRKRFKTHIAENDKTKAYALRDESNTTTEGDYSEKPGQKYENTDFKYANDNSTYLILTGHLSYIDNLNYQVNADVRFIIHLGYVSGDANDYDTKRNGHYTYNVTIKGVNDIIVEVTNENESDNEVRPGYEGDVVYSSNTIFELDSHYDRCLLEIPPSLVTNQMTWGIKTPFSSGVHAPGSTSYSGVEDYKWIKFAINKLHNKPHGEYVKYPGDGKYDATIANPNGLLDIDQLITYLKQVKDSDPTMSSLLADGVPNGNEHICITAFVDENIYISDPRQTTGIEDLTIWKRTVDRDDRQLHILIPFDDGSGINKDVVYSPDGNSSVVNSLYTFTQKAIRTVYNANHPTLRSAWGLESVMEANEGDTYGGRLPGGNVSQKCDTRNGRENTLKIILGDSYKTAPKEVHWTDVVETSTRYGLKSGYQNVAYACLLRNRDLNGDNIVQANEIRWYIASIDQLTDIYLGEYALDEASRLYPTNKADRPGGNSVYWHYTSSSYNDNDKAPWVLWAEEGASRGSFTDSQKLNGDRYSYRCIRNLGIGLDDVTTNPEDLVDVKDNGDGTYTIDLTRMNPKARRSNLETTPLPIHNERSDNNRPYEGFIVAKDAYPENRLEAVNGGHTEVYGTETTEGDVGYKWINQYEWQYYQTHNPCPAGYRIPNQRELLIMTSRMSENQWPSYSVTATYWVRDSSWGNFWEFKEHQESKEISDLRPLYYISQTAFSMDGQSPYNSSRDGFLWESNKKVFMLQNNTDEKGYVRPIKDVNITY